jgi:hypothetical protein
MLEFIHRVTYIYIYLYICMYIYTLKHSVSEADSASVVRQKAPNVLDPLNQAILSHSVPLQHSQV